MQVNTLERIVAESVDQQRSKFYGKYRGLVTNTDDPEKMGRIKASVHEVLGDKETHWALPCVPYGGDEVGIYCVPPVGAGVWIEFEAGDPARPIWAGCRWKKGKVPEDENKKSAEQSIKVIRTESGVMVTMDDKNQQISVSDKDGSNILNIDAKNGLVTLKGAKKVVVESPQIELVEKATHPVVFGDELMSYLNQLVQMFSTHTHPGETCMGIPVTPSTPVPPLPTPMQTMLSKKVKAG